MLANKTISGEGAKVGAALEELEREGFVMLRHLVEPERIAALRRELDPWFERTPTCVGDFYGWHTTRVGGVLAKAPASWDVVLHPTILAIAEALLGPGCDCIQLNLTQGVRVHPGERAQAPHRDEEMWPLPEKRGHWLINVMWPIDPFTEANGATRLWPRSHRAALDRRLDPASSVGAVMDPGSALVFLGSLTHGAGANRSERARSGLIVSYCLGWLKTYENQFLAYPRDIARSFPAELQALIGYRMHRPNLGGWEGRDPSAYLDGAGIGPHVDALPPEIGEELKRYYGG